MINPGNAMPRCCSVYIWYAKRNMATAPNSELPKLHSKKVRNPNPVYPTKLLSSVLNILGEMNYRKRGLLKSQLSKAKNNTVYTTPRQPSNREFKKLTQNMEDYDAVEDINIRSLERSKNSRKEELKKEDFLMLRSLPVLYFIAERIFTELKTFKPDFQPLDMLDFGHNLGASVWAAHDFYGESIEDYIIHEHNKPEYNRTLQLLNSKYDPHIPNVQVKGSYSLTRLKTKSYDIVTAINYFPYLQSYQLKQAVPLLWGMTNNVLIIADISNKYTASRMNEVRNEFLKMQKKCIDGYILAPCPHAHKCPMVASNDPNGCRFSTSNIRKHPKLTPYTAEQKQLLSHLGTDYSYLILAKGNKYIDRDYSRILAPIKQLKKDNRLEVLTCNSDGRMYKSIVPAKSSKVLYHHLKYKKSGDLLDEGWSDHRHVNLSLPLRSLTVEEKVTQLRLRQRKRFDRKVNDTGDARASYDVNDATLRDEYGESDDALLSREELNRQLDDGFDDISMAEKGHERYPNDKEEDHWDI